MLRIATHDEDARQSFVPSFKVHLFGEISPGNRTVYDGKVRPEFRRTNNRNFAARQEIWHSMLADPYYQMFSSLKRTQQELMWESSGTTTEREYGELHKKAKNSGIAAGQPRVAAPRSRSRTASL
jgi:hypothetical protein